MQEKKFIPYDSPEAAQYRTITGWVSKDGRFWGDNEHMARYSGCTHVLCSKCKKEYVERGRTKCKKCQHTDYINAYSKMPYKDWDGVTPITLYDSDEYFMDIDDLFFYTEENEVNPKDLMLVLCDPIYPRLLDTDYWEDDLPDPDYDIPEELERLISEFNERVKKIDIISWIPGKYRTTVEEFHNVT